MSEQPPKISQLRSVVKPPRPVEETTEDVTAEAIEERPVTLEQLLGEIHGLSRLVAWLSKNVQGLTAAQELTRREVAQLSALVTWDHAPRLTKVETTLGTRAKGLALVSGKYAGVLTLVGLAGRAAAKQWPEFGQAIEAALAALGL